MHVGINTGEVIVRSIRKDDLHTDYVPVGHSTNLAARMEQMASPGSILITDYTKKLTEGFFDLKALGAAEIKGVAEPLAVYEVVGIGQLRTRLQVTATRRGLTRFVGRQSEMEHLQPLVLIFEDLHWIDGETQDLLDVLSDSVASARLLLLVNYRPEYWQEWGNKTY